MNKTTSNEFGQEIGVSLNHWSGAKTPQTITLYGQYCTLKPFDLERDAKQLYASFDIEHHKQDWTYLYHGPFDDFKSFQRWLKAFCCGVDPLFLTIFDHATNAPVGLASYLRIQPKAGVIEVGSIHFSHLMQQSVLSTEAMYLMMSYVFDELNYRRYEWKTDSLNHRSRSAALRLGFTYEGIFRQAAHYKNRNRDTAWFAIIDSEWPKLKKSFEAWLNKTNFDQKGKQITPLRVFSTTSS